MYAGVQFPMAESGDLENNGTNSNPTFTFPDPGVTHHVRMSPSWVMSAQILMPEFEAASLVADTPIHLAGGLSLGEGNLVLMPGCSLEFTGFASLLSGTVLAGGNEVSVSGTGYVSGVTIDQGVCGERLVVQSEALFTNGLTVSGTLTGHSSTVANITVEGRLENVGRIEDGGRPVNRRYASAPARHQRYHGPHDGEVTYVEGDLHPHSHRFRHEQLPL